MTHQHVFHRIGEVNRRMLPNETTSVSMPFRLEPGVEVVCVSCGQVRRAYADGTVEVTQQGGEPIADHASGS